MFRQFIPILRKLSGLQYFKIISSGFFLSFVLYVYQAFGIQTGLSFSGHSLLVRAVIFGASTSVTMAFLEFIRVKRLWWEPFEVFMGANVTFLWFNYFWDFTELSFYAYFLLLFEYFTVMLVPFGIYHFLSRSTKDDRIVLTSSSGKDRIAIRDSNLLVVKAEDNYVQLVIRSGKVTERKLLRKKLSEIEKELKRFKVFRRVHRSYIVNIGRVSKAERNHSKQLVLYFDGEVEVPVSEKYVQEIEREFFTTH